MDGWMDGWTDGRTDGAIGRLDEWGRSDYRMLPQDVHVTFIDMFDRN